MSIFWRVKRGIDSYIHYLEHFGQEGRKSCCFQPNGFLSMLHCHLAIRLVGKHGAYHEGTSTQGYIYNGVRNCVIIIDYYY